MLRDGVPDGLRRTLLDWVVSSIKVQGRVSWFISDERVSSLERVTDHVLPRSEAPLREYLWDRPDLLLDVVDHLLGTRFESGHRAELSPVAELDKALEEGRSVWTVGVDGEKRFELQQRQSNEMTEVMRQAMTTGGRPAEHLRRAWSKAFGREADPNGACDEAVKAIEVVAKPVVSPNNARATLGTMIADMRNKPSKWETTSEADDDVDRIISMMQMVWQGHYRHGDETQPIDVSDEGAIMVVQLATVLVEWFRSGHVRPTAS